MPEAGSPVEILRCGSEHAAAWDAFVDACDDASFYHLFGWKQINEAVFGHETIYLAARSGGSITGIFPVVFLKSRLFGRILCSMPFVNFGGPCALDARSEQMLLQEAAVIVKETCADYLEIRSLRKVGSDLPSSEHKVSLTVPLDPDPEKIWNGFNTKHRTDIRKAYKNGITVTAGGRDMLDIFYELLSSNWRDLGTPIYKKEYFERILSVFPDRMKIFVASHENRPVGVAMNGYYKTIVEGTWAATRPGAKHSHTNYALYWEMIKHACESGYSFFHLGRSTAGSGGDLFKRKWNAEPKQLYWQYILGRRRQVPSLNVNNPKYRFAIRTWRILPVGATQVIGPFLSRSIP